MEEDDDDFYGGADPNQQVQSEQATPQQYPPDQNGGQEDEMDDEDDDEEEDDSDIDIVLDRPEGAVDSPPPSKRQRGPESARPESTAPPTGAGRSGTPSARPETSQQPRSGSTQPPTNVKGTLQYNGKQGKDFPQISKPNGIDVNATPVWPSANKPITEVDIDADLAENSKLWRLPGTDQTDFFNYGFDEYTWTQYCLKQQAMTNTIAEGKEADARMKAMFGGGGNGNANEAVPGVGAMGPGAMDGGGGGGGMPPGMPTEQDMAMMAQMFGMTPDQMMQQMMSGGPMPGQDGRGFGGSPMPQGPGGGGFQPPSGPSGGGDMGGFSAQQMAIMQQEQGGGYGGGGGRGRGRGRRGYY